MMSPGWRLPGSFGSAAPRPAVFFKGTDGDLWDISHTGGWGEAVNLGGGPLGSAPTAGIDAQGNLFVFWEGTDASLWNRSYIGGHWLNPAKIHLVGRLGSRPRSKSARTGSKTSSFAPPPAD